MPVTRRSTRLPEKEVDMGLLWTIIVLGIVLVAVPAVAAYTLFEMSPFGRHSDHFRDPQTGGRRWDAPNLEDGHY
jgi:hypothetical protein